MGRLGRKLRAIIWVPEEDQQRWVSTCLAYCERHRYQVDSVIVGGENKWREIWNALTSGAADICVVPSKSPVRNRLPRLEAVTEELPRVEEHRARRTRLIRPDEEA